MLEQEPFLLHLDLLSRQHHQSVFQVKELLSNHGEGIINTDANFRLKHRSIAVRQLRMFLYNVRFAGFHRSYDDQ